MPGPNPTFDPTRKIPAFYSRHPNRSPNEIQELFNNAERAVKASEAILKQAAQVAKLVVKEDEPWIARYSNLKQSTSFPAASSAPTKRPPVKEDAIGAAAPTVAPEITTGGHCNTNHIIPWIIPENGGKPDVESNRVREMLRNRLNRQRLELPETRGDEKWDRPRQPGERRRRIVRDKDAAEAPSEPPPSGYVIFVGLMTTKLRHDRGPDATHSQTAVVQEISRLWRNNMTQNDQDYYNKMAELIRQEYLQQMIEFRATDSFRQSEKFIRLGNGLGPWAHRKPEDHNALEKEVAAYDTVIFPPRPPSKNEAYAEREKQSKFRRKEKLRMEAEERKARKRALVRQATAEHFHPKKQQRRASGDSSPR